MGLDYEKWKELHSKYKTTTNVKTITSIFAAIVIAFIIFYFINK